MIDGRTVMECDPAGKSAQEIAALWTYVADRLNRAVPHPGMLGDRGAIDAPHVATMTQGGGFGRRAPAPTA